MWATSATATSATGKNCGIHPTPTWPVACPAILALDSLTEREREVLVLVAEGLSNQEVADRLVVSPSTAKTHVNRAMAKIGAHDRAQLVVLAYESGLVRPGWLT